ncbi:hypothetical protein L873DRAFT_669719 [Choiromyces venosus 120613-1]|uniref:Uncharacterized protein n=1 Tax=Choiromyces venosus 120613-1 TaxID=1336337 RepID=A0A3N4JYS3_9PEZI|nr:hypothetical protein L873DRAFT_669719 [Choiromyces venosus 120613-1]
MLHNTPSVTFHTLLYFLFGKCLALVILLDIVIDVSFQLDNNNHPSTTTGWANPVLFNLLFLTVTECISHWTITINSYTIISQDTKPDKSKETNRFSVVATPSPRKRREKKPSTPLLEYCRW